MRPAGWIIHSPIQKNGTSPSGALIDLLSFYHDLTFMKHREQFFKYLYRAASYCLGSNIQRLDKVEVRDGECMIQWQGHGYSRAEFAVQ